MSVEHEQSDMKTSENENKGLTVFFPGLDHQCLFSRIGCLFLPGLDIFFLGSDVCFFQDQMSISIDIRSYLPFQVASFSE